MTTQLDTREPKLVVHPLTGEALDLGVATMLTRVCRPAGATGTNGPFARIMALVRALAVPQQVLCAAQCPLDEISSLTQRLKQDARRGHPPR